MEFGLIREEDTLKIYGAGILSSAGETIFCLTDKTPKYPFDVEVLTETDFRKDVFQDKYFVIDSYEQLYSSIPEIKEVIARKVKAVKAA